MPYGLKDEDFAKIQNKIVKKLYEIPSLDRVPFLVGCTEQELRGAMTELRKTPKSKGKIEAIERELRNRGSKNKKNKIFPKRTGGKEIREGVDKSVWEDKEGRRMKEYIKCPECPMCKPQPGKRDGVKWGICHNGGNMVYLEPRKIKRASGSGYIYKPISSCGMYGKGE